MSQIIRLDQNFGACQPWQLTRFDAPELDEAVEEPVPEPEPAPIAEQDETVPAAIEIAPGVQLPTAEDIERIEQEAWKEGYAAGYEEGSARGRIEAAQLYQLVQALDGALSKFDQEVAEEIQSLALEVARQVVRDTLARTPECILAIVREALQSLPQHAATIRVHPADAQLLRRYLAEQHQGIGHRIAEDDTIAEGGCLIEAGGTQIDAQVHTRWRRVVESLSKSAADYRSE